MIYNDETGLTNFLAIHNQRNMMIVKRKSVIRRVISFKLFILACVTVAVFFGPAVAGEFYRNYQIEREISSLKSEINAMEKNNYELTKLVEYYNTKEYREAEARKRLGVKKEGESVVIVKPGAQSVNLEKSGVEIINNDDISNYIKWWNYFFKDKN